MLPLLAAEIDDLTDLGAPGWDAGIDEAVRLLRNTAERFRP